MEANQDQSFFGYLSHHAIHSPLQGSHEQVARFNEKGFGSQHQFAMHVELYNLASDIGELHDVANAEPVKRDELIDDLLAWFKRSGALLPSEPNPGYSSAAVVSQGKGQRKKNQKAAIN